MSELSQPWDGTDIGHAASRAPYSEQEWDEMWETWFGSLGNHGVIPGIDNELEVTVTGLNTIQVDAGCALVKGKWYRNTAPISINVPDASAGNWREDGIILRCDWAAKTITVVRKENTTGENTAWDNSMLTQTEGTTWEIPLASVRVDDAGNLTNLTDLRETVRPNMMLWARKGDDENDWSQGAPSGPTCYFPSAPCIQTGVATLTGSGDAGAGGSNNVFFCEEYAYPPIVIFSCIGTTYDGTVKDAEVWIGNVSATMFTIYWRFLQNGSSLSAFPVNWIALGPKSIG